ncbi:PREDICTED: HMG-Y-related protein B-like [Fragaria vesca subsp. vesca]|uniref:HMG-Y-related protein B-like n=1 Tax=Fragaria vesca subsp. vesca TaxID=101020 RepID=UPI0002C31091|nr:PREDICTED: HMG-Y-related protein B-like [Fragaria vesca subsp. vesca]
MSPIRVTPINSFSTVRLHTQPPSLTVESHSGGHPPSLENAPFKFLLSFISFSASHSLPDSSLRLQRELSWPPLSPPTTHRHRQIQLLLAQHLEKMKQSGELAFVKNNYMKPDPNVPPKRGRGRPPKPKVPGAEGAAAVVSSPPRPRGRPPKAKDPFFLIPTVQTSTSGGGSRRPRGRPQKKAKTAPANAPAAPASGGGSGAPRGRGRPSKVKPSVAPVGC